MLLVKKKDAKKEDFLNIGLTEGEFNKLDNFLLRKEEFKTWCSTYAMENLSQSPPSQVNHHPYGKGSVGMSKIQQPQVLDSFHQDLKSSLDISRRSNLTEENSKEIKVKRME